MQLVASPGHRDVEQPALLFQFVRRAGAEVGRDGAIDDVQHVHVLPFLAFGRMDGREDQEILVEQRHPRLVRGGVGRVERQLGDEAFAARIAGGDLLELVEVLLPDLGILVHCLHQRLVPHAGPEQFGRPAATALAQVFHHFEQRRPGLRATRRGRGVQQLDQRVRRFGHAIEHLARGARPDPGQQLQHAEAGHPVARIVDEAQQRQHVLDVGAVEELQPAIFDERDVAPGQLDLEFGRMRGGAEQHRLLLQCGAALAAGEDALDHVAGLARLILHRHQPRLLGGGALGPEVLGEALLALRDHRVGRLKDRLGGAVVAVERHHPGRRRKGVREIEDVAHRRGPERVDRLRVVADHGQPLA
eukprot:Opistho-1_new@17125